MKHLVIAEKPSVARDIARVLHCNKKTNTYIEGTEYIVTWALGHLVTLADPEEYGKEYQSWDLETLPMLPKDWKLVVIKQTGRQFHAVKEQIFRKDVSDIIIATDAGREGELVARWILEKAGNKKPLKRLWISSRISLSKTLPGFQFSSVSFFISRSACSITSLSVSSRAVTRVTLNSAGSLYRGFAVFIKMPYS